MGIRFFCPHCDRRLHVKEFLAGRRGICPHCDEGIVIPAESTVGPEADDPADPESPATPSRDDVPSDPAVASVPGRDRRGNRATRSADRVSEIDELASASDVAIDLVILSDAADPIDASPHLLWYVRPVAGGQYGPAEGTILRRWLAEGRVSDNTLVWQEGWEEWREAREVFGSTAEPAAVPSQPAPRATVTAVPPDSAEAVPGASRSRTATPLGSKADVSSDRNPIAPLDEAKGKLLDYRLRRTRDRGREWVAVVLLGLLCVGLIVALGLVLTGRI